MKKPTSVYDGHADRESEIWCSAHSNVGHVALDIMKTVMEDGEAKIGCIGPEAVNNAIKALIHVRERLDEEQEIDIWPSFSTIIDKNDEEKTRIVFFIMLTEHSTI